MIPELQFFHWLKQWQNRMFSLQFTAGFPSGPPGDPAVPPVAEASRRGVVCATTPSRPTVGSRVRGQTRRCETVTISCVQVLSSVDRWARARFCSLTMDCPSSSSFHWNVADGGMSHLVQWTVAGQNGACGKNAQGAVDMATEPGPELAVIHQLNTAGGRVKGVLWKWSCATLGLAQVRIHQGAQFSYF